MKKDTVVHVRLIFGKCHIDDTKIHGKENIIDKLQVLFYARKNFARERAAKTPNF